MHSLLLAFLVAATLIPAAAAQSVSTTLQLDTPSSTNVVDLTLSAGALGTSTRTATLSGTADVLIDVTPNGSGFDVTGLTLTGGTTNISDVTFDLAFGISAAATNLSGTPFTTTPPGVVTAGSFQAAEHGFTVDMGTVVAAGSTIDFMTSPFTGNGEGVGTITTTPGALVAGFEVLDIVLELPVEFSEPFDIPNVPFLGTVTANFSGGGTLRASGSLQIPIVSGLACDFDADGDCEIDDLDALYSEIAAGTATSADIVGWLADASDPSNTGLLNPADELVLGDVDLDGDVGSTDLGLLLNQFNSTSGPGWSGGDLNADLNVDSTDLGLLLNEFGHASAAASAVPEPSSPCLVAFFCAWLTLAFRRRK